MRYGFIYPLWRMVITILQKLNLVELFKYIAVKYLADPTNIRQNEQYRRIAVDLFIVLKWIFVLFLWFSRTKSDITTIVIWYLIFSNLLTYIYEHVWKDEAINVSPPDNDRTRRKFILFIMSFTFSNVCFAYLYSISFVTHMKWVDHGASRIKALWFSMSNSIAANYDVIKTHTDFSNNVAMIQLIITFIFVSVILGKSVPSST